MRYKDFYYYNKNTKNRINWRHIIRPKQKAKEQNNLVGRMQEGRKDVLAFYEFTECYIIVLDHGYAANICDFNF